MNNQWRVNTRYTCQSSLKNSNPSVSKQVYLIIQKESPISDKWKGLLRYPQMISPSCGAFPLLDYGSALRQTQE
ncbi:hypothetical protein Scep_016660 [Stephania cephalantha]|uniref:Uncharacterized protein n=1 Tax=Stephania cephalantha TaxID=152367 RepID=A0AAP0NSU5_9MAGN